MTENEAIKNIQYRIYTAGSIVGNGNNGTAYEDLEMAIQALEEIQSYRAVGTVEEIQNMKDNGSFTGMELAQIAAMQMQLKDYQSIGTIDEFKALKEKNEPKKILYRKQSYGTPWLCPYCEADQIKVEFFSEDGSEPKEKYTFCWQCGTRIDWSE